jgi:hypothetical protein
MGDRQIHAQSMIQDKPLEFVVLGLARCQQPDECQDRCREEVVADILQPVGLGEPSGDVRCE